MMTTKQIDALKLALDALERQIESIKQMPIARRENGMVVFAVPEAAWVGLTCCVNDMRQALAEQSAQQQEPQPPYEFERYVAGSLRAQGVRVERATTLADAMRIAAKICPPANPPSAPTVLVYTSPPASKPWVGLTDEDKREIVTNNSSPLGGMLDAEAKLREKNAAPCKPLTDLVKAAQGVLEWTEIAHRPPVRDRLEVGRMVGVRLHALADLHDALTAHGIKGDA